MGKPMRPAALDDVIARTAAPADDQRAGVAHRQTPLFDPSVLADACQGDDDACASLIALFVEHSRGNVAALAEAVAAGDLEAVQRVAHGLKGSSAVIGALQLAELSSRLGEAARKGRVTEMSAVQAELERSFAMTSAALEHGRVVAS